jgi:hypothetical protein
MYFIFNKTTSQIQEKIPSRALLEYVIITRENKIAKNKII